MEIISYLKSLSESLILSKSEQTSILKSLQVLNRRLQTQFGDEIVEQYTIGSYTRGTILPREIDEKSDVDFLTVFKNGKEYKVQSLMTKLKEFVKGSYVRSDISQDFPTIVLELNHIKFEIVPAYYNSFWLQYHIPSKESLFTEWTETNPTKFNEKLITKNSKNSGMIIPIIRLLKYWNVVNGYIYNSYGLEKTIIENTYFHNENLKSLFFECIKDLDTQGLSEENKIKVEKAKKIVRYIKKAELDSLNEFSDYGIKLLLPELNDYKNRLKLVKN